MRLSPCISWIAAVLLTSLTTSSTAALAQDGSLDQMLFGQKPKPFIDPAGYWAAILPTGFDCQARARHVSCNGNRGVQALLTVDVIDVPPSATADIAMLNQMDKFKTKPHFKLIQKGTIKVDKAPAVLVDFS